nr:hypothetical protein [uncultured Desulfovibrio sp.]
MGKLTDTKLRSMKPNGKVQKESDGDGPYAYFGAKSKSISWQMGYRFENKQKVLTLEDTRRSVWPRPAGSALRPGKCLRMDATPAKSRNLKGKPPCLPRRKRR